MNDSLVPAVDAVVPLQFAAEVQEHLVVACNDLDRLQALLTDACDALMTSFRGAVGQIDRTLEEGGTAQVDAALESVRRHLGAAVTALQFHDLGTQLLGHTRQRLQSCADRMAADAFGCDEDGEGIVDQMPRHPNPVTRAEMDAGSVELFN